MSEVTVNIRCSNGEKFTTQVELTATVLALKQKIAGQANVVPELQRLIYKGRVLKEDGNTLASYTVEANSTVHLVRSQAPNPAPAPAATATPAAGVPTLFDMPGAGGGTPGAGAANPFADMMGSMGGMGGAGMDINRMQQQLMSNPEMMSNIMNSPMMESLLNNPEMMRNIMFSNPQMQRVMENNPQLAQVLNDPAMMRQYLEMARNPEAMNQARRSQDLMMSQIENQPGGFNALRRLYTDVQEPLMQASDGMVDNNNSANTSNAPGGTQSTESGANPSAGPNTAALPNPWAPAGAPAAAPAANPATLGMAGLGGANASNPWAGLGGAGAGAGAGTGAGAGFPGMGGMPGMPGMPGFGGMGGQMNPAMMSEMMNNPMVQQMVSQMADNPALMESMIAQNPALQQAIQANPAMRQQLPQMMRQMADPQNMQAIAQMQSAMQQLQRAGIIPPGGMPGMPGTGGTAGGASDGTGGGLGPGLAGLANFGNLNLGGAPSGNQSAAARGLDFSALLGGSPPSNPWAPAPPSTGTPTPSTSGTPNPAPTQTPVAPVAVANPEETYAAQLTQMNDMGFTDRAACVRALVASQGNVNAAVERMLGGGV